MKWAIYNPSFTYEDRADVPRTEDSALTDEESAIKYEDVSNKSGKTGSGIEYTKFERVIYTYDPIKFKEDDVIYFYDNGKSLKITDIDIIVPENKKKAVAFWGSQLELMVAKKVLYLK